MSTIVKMLARWSELAPRNSQANREEAELNRLINGDEGPEDSMIMMDIVHEYGPVVFDLKDIHHFNRAKEKDHVTIHFRKAESSLIVKAGFSDFMELYMEQMGVQIMDCTPLDYEDDIPEDESIEGDEEDLEL